MKLSLAIQMHDLLLNTLQAKIPLSESDVELCEQLFKVQQVRKKEKLLKEGDVCKYTAFVSRGCLRSFTVTAKGGENVIQFAIEGWWITDMFSFLTGEAASITIEALEDSYVLLIDRESREILFSKIPQFERFFRLLLENNYIATHRRLLSALTGTSEERFLEFSRRYPQIVNRVPQHMIASYLGISPETLSRIRNSIMKKS